MEETTNLTERKFGYVVPPMPPPPPPLPPPPPPVPPPPPPAFVQGWITYINSYMDIRLKQMYDKIARGYFIIDEASFDQMRVNDIILGGVSLRAIIAKLMGMQPLPPPPVPPIPPSPPPPPPPIVPPVWPPAPGPFYPYPFTPPPGQEGGGSGSEVTKEQMKEYFTEAVTEWYDNILADKYKTRDNIKLRDRQTHHVHELFIDRGVVRTIDLDEQAQNGSVCTCESCTCDCHTTESDTDENIYDNLLFKDRFTSKTYELYISNGVVMTNAVEVPVNG